MTRDIEIPNGLLDLDLSKGPIRPMNQKELIIALKFCVARLFFIRARKYVDRNSRRWDDTFTAEQLLVFVGISDTHRRQAHKMIIDQLVDEGCLSLNEKTNTFRLRPKFVPFIQTQLEAYIAEQLKTRQKKEEK